ncbi:hypothetical protein R3I93_016915 [Phoxinus phoxinus]|uniref:Uncharacterized protein n=1 Tax=Phoxinus phoxinus TaxID=58324 RepID=A0AAN9GYB8_9TELE
MIKRDINR